MIIQIIEKEINQRDFELISQDEKHPLHRNVKMVVHVFNTGVTIKKYYVTMYYILS